MQEPCTKMT